jgi:hypothetical protein
MEISISKIGEWDCAFKIRTFFWLQGVLVFKSAIWGLYHSVLMG